MNKQPKGTTMDTNTLDLDSIVLEAGSHSADSGKFCLELVSVRAGEPMTDHPDATSPVLASFGRSLNDALPDDMRQRLLPLTDALIGTRDDGLDDVRSQMITDWFIRTHIPMTLRYANLADQANTLAVLPELAEDNADAAVESVRSAARAARAAWAAWDAWAAAFDLAAQYAAEQAGTPLNGDTIATLMAPMIREMQESQIALFEKIVSLGKLDAVSHG